MDCIVVVCCYWLSVICYWLLDSGYWMLDAYSGVRDQVSGISLSVDSNWLWFSVMGRRLDTSCWILVIGFLLSVICFFLQPSVFSLNTPLIPNNWSVLVRVCLWLSLFIATNKFASIEAVAGDLVPRPSPIYTASWPTKS